MYENVAGGDGDGNSNKKDSNDNNAPESQFKKSRLKARNVNYECPECK
jgi:hypothetical protein